MSEIKYLSVRFEGDNDDSYSNSDTEPEPEPEPIKEEQFMTRGAPHKTPTPSPKTPESIHNSQVTLNVTSDGEISNYIIFLF